MDEACDDELNGYRRYDHDDGGKGIWGKPLLILWLKEGMKKKMRKETRKEVMKEMEEKTSVG